MEKISAPQHDEKTLQAVICSSDNQVRLFTDAFEVSCYSVIVEMIASGDR